MSPRSRLVAPVVPVATASTTTACSVTTSGSGSGSASPSCSPGQPSPHTFSWSSEEEPHAARRKAILAQHPEIAELFGTEPLTFYLTAGMFVTQVCLAYACREASIWTILPVAYIIGGTINHSLQLAVHELSHNLCWSSPTANKLTAIMANLVTGIPSSVTFQRYHMDHHQFQGQDGIDTDIPCSFEVNYFTSCVAKLFWIVCQPFCYALRPMLIKPKPMSAWELTNWIVQVLFDVAIVYFFGVRSLSYLLIGTFLGIGLHPAAGHFIAEHYEYAKGHETYSYYGILNYVNFNVGYHNEHHDFPRVPWSRLPQVKAAAPTFYDTLPCYTSYLAVFYKYVTDPTIGPFSRIKRTPSETTSAVMTRAKVSKTTNPMRYVVFAVFTCIFAVAVGSVPYALYAIVA